MAHEAREHHDRPLGGGRAAEDPELRPSPRDGQTTVQMRVGPQGLIHAHDGARFWPHCMSMACREAVRRPFVACDARVSTRALAFVQ